MDALFTEITARYLHERLRFTGRPGEADTILAACKFIDGEKPATLNGGPFVVKVREEETLHENQEYRFLGKWTRYTHPRLQTTEDQFAADSFTESTPAGREGIIAYLIRAGEGNGIGPGRAAKIYDLYLSDAIRTVREEPARVAAAVRGLSLSDAEATATWLKARQATEATSLDLTELLNGRGFLKSTPKKAIDLWGARATRVVRRDPYKLMAIRGAGFKRCDAMYLSLGLPPNRLKRQALCAWYAVQLETKLHGHTWIAAAVVDHGLRTQIGGCQPDLILALKLAKRAGILAIKVDGGKSWIADSRRARNEQYIAERIAAANVLPPSWPDCDDASQLTEHQRDRLRNALVGRICSLGGSPGTGKTFTAAALIRRIIAEHGQEWIAVVAPTGKAAVRISEALAEYKLPIRARTIHSTLGIDRSSVAEKSESDGWGFTHHERNPLPFRFVVVDESSMIDTDLMASLLRACATGTHVLFVGDVNQLSPVGHGAPLRDLIAAGVPYGELTEIHRNAGMIVKACAAIRDGKRFEVQSGLVGIGDNANLAVQGGDQRQNMLAAIRYFADVQHGFDPVWDIQILAAVNKKSPLSRRELNKILQSELNSSPVIDGSPFRLGDKVVNTQNGWYRTAKIVNQDELDDDADEFYDDETSQPNIEVYVANGEIGRVVDVAEKTLTVQLDSPRRIVIVPRGKPVEEKDDDAPADDSTSDKTNTGCKWDLAYCLSVHKSQGSEFPVVLVMLDEYSGARRVTSREWIYTAISRAKKACVLIGNIETAYRMTRRVALGDRKTLLAETIRQEQCKRIMEAIL